MSKDDPGFSQSTHYRRKKNRLQLQISNCRRMLRLQAERIAVIDDPLTPLTLETILRLERTLTEIEFGLMTLKTEEKPKQQEPQP